MFLREGGNSWARRFGESNDESIISPVTNITQVVDKDSAVLGYTNEESIAVATDHRGLVRYQDVNDDNFDLVRKTILVKVEDILSATEAARGIDIQIAD
jgi:hypothetical protein